MRISAVSVLEYTRRLDGRSWNPSFRWTERRAPLVVVEADTGHSGIGEAWCAQPAIAAILAHLGDVVAPHLLGRELVDAASIRRLVGGDPTIDGAGGQAWIGAAAASAVDIALWDLLARSLGQPLWRTLGGRSNRVRVYASGGLYRDGDGVDELVAEMRHHVEAGFDFLKMKVGALPLKADLQRVSAVAAAGGSGAKLWVDAVNQLDRDTAAIWATSLHEAGAAAIQAPVPFDDLATMARINALYLPVIAGEAATGIDRLERLCLADAVAFLQPNIGLCGGFSAADGIASLARSRGIDVTLQTFGTAVLQVASLHLGAAANLHSVEYHCFHDHLKFLLPARLADVTGGCLEVGDEPGLGIRIPQPGTQEDGGFIRSHRRLSTQQ